MVDTRQIGAAPTALLQALAEGPLSRDQVKARLQLDWRQTTNAARSLGRRGYLDVLADGSYRLSDAGQIAAAAGEVITGGPKGQVKIVRDTFRQRCWSSMRVHRAFTIGQIVADAVSEEDGGQPRDNAARYLNRLRAAGYVKELPRRLPGTSNGSNGFKRFMLVKNTGPEAPVFREALLAIHDPNTGEDVPCSLL